MTGFRITNRRMAGSDHAVVTVEGGRGVYRHEVCAECPWRLDSPINAFPAQAYRHSADTAYDAAGNCFACHMAGAEKIQVCAGFLLAQGAHNLGARFAMMRGDLDPSKLRRTVPTYRTYRDMAVANGVDPDDPALRLCRDDAQMTESK